MLANNNNLDFKDKRLYHLEYYLDSLIISIDAKYTPCFALYFTFG